MSACYNGPVNTLEGIMSEDSSFAVLFQQVRTCNQETAAQLVRQSEPAVRRSDDA
jgi:hypothetical protein